MVTHLNPGARRTAARGGLLAAGVLAFALALGGSLVSPDTQQPTLQAQDKPEIFDHGQPQHRMPCGTCHQVKEGRKGKVTTYAIETRGTPDQHKPCSDSGCHSDKRFGTKLETFCFACHHHKTSFPDAPQARRRGQSNWVLAKFDHGDHLKRVGGSCDQCHTDNKDTRPYDRTAVVRDMTMPGHTECGQCHDKLAPKVNDPNGCEGCHVLPAGQIKPGSYADMDNYRVSMAFKPKAGRGRGALPVSTFHAGHAKKSKAKDCQLCHNNVGTGPGEVVPLPAKATCEGCHNGKSVFGVLSTDCTRCHVAPNGGTK